MTSEINDGDQNDITINDSEVMIVGEDGTVYVADIGETVGADVRRICANGNDAHVHFGDVNPYSDISQGQSEENSSPDAAKTTVHPHDDPKRREKISDGIANDRKDEKKRKGIYGLPR